MIRFNVQFANSLRAPLGVTNKEVINYTHLLNVVNVKYVTSPTYTALANAPAVIAKISCYKSIVVILGIWVFLIFVY